VRNRGFIKLHRKFTDWEWYSDNNTKIVFLHLLLTANHQETKYRGVTVPVGSVVTGYEALASQVSLSVRNVRTALKHLKATGEVTSKVTSSFSVLTIEKWAIYQGDTRQSDKQSGSHSDKQVTSSRQASDKQVTVSKECKNVRKEETNNNAKVNFASFPSQPDAALISDWFKIRKSKRLVNTQKAIDAVGRELHKALAKGYDVDQCLNTIVENSWGGFKATWLETNTEVQPAVKQPVGLQALPENWDEWDA